MRKYANLVSTWEGLGEERKVTGEEKGVMGEDIRGREEVMGREEGKE